MNSREKGKRGERQWRDELRANGYAARRGQQFAGGPESPDVVCEELAWIHFEVKAVERLNIEDAMDQARGDARMQNGEQKIPIVAHRRNYRPWLVTMEASTFFRLLRGDFDSRQDAKAQAQAGPANNFTEGNQPNGEKNFTEGNKENKGEPGDQRISAGDECPRPSVEEQNK